MWPASKSLPGRAAGLSLSAGLVAFGCLVPDIELVDRLPDSGAGAAGRGGEGQSGSGSEGGEPTSEGGADPGSAGEPARGGEQSRSGAGGAAETGGSGSGGTAGAGGSGGTIATEIPELNACATNTYQVCDDFEGQLSDGWPPGFEATAVTDAPSGGAVLVADYGFQPQLRLSFTAISVSFWVRLETNTDQRFISFAQGNDEFGLGMEHDRARFLHSGTDGMIAPTDDNRTRLLSAMTWMCVQLRVDALTSVIESRIVVPGDAPFDLPPLDDTPTTDEDADWHQQSGPPLIDSGILIFGQQGAYQQFDDVVVGDYDQQTLCDLYLEAVGG